VQITYSSRIDAGHKIRVTDEKVVDVVDVAVVQNDEL
jgi:hypothetical protein